MTGLTPHRPHALSAAERVERNRRIAAAKAAGATWPEVADAFGVSEKTARRAAAEHAATAAPPADADLDAETLVRRVLQVHDVALDRLERLAARADNDSARVGAARSLATVSVSLLDVLGRLGLLNDPALSRYYAEMRRAGVGIVLLARRHNIPFEEVDRALGEVPLAMRFAREAAAA